MPVECYRVVEYRELSGGEVEVETYSLGPDNTNLTALLQLVVPGIRPVRETVGDLSGDHSVRYRLEPRDRQAALALFESHRSPIVTAIDTNCDISVCLDFYQHPAEEDSGQRWEPTAIGELVYDAKYRWKQAAAAECRNRLASYIESHPVLRQLTGITAMPGSSGVTSRLLSMAARAVSRSLDVPVVDLQRIRKTEPQKDYTDSENPDENQQNTMSGSLVGDPDLIVVLDDLMRDGSTVREASRALREAGARKVGSVTLVKDRTGTRRYVFD